MDSLFKETIQVTQAAGQAIMRYYNDSFTVRDKSPDNPVTDADLAADSLLKEHLMQLVPEAGWLSEETTDSQTRLEKRLVWVVDPLDGTKEFVLGIPEFSVSVALVEDGLPIIGIIYNPASGELFAALRGSGINLNGNPLRVSDRTQLEGAQIDASRSERKRGEFEPFESLFKIQTMGSIAFKLARVSAGLVDATWSRGPKNEWDICAGVCLIEEAGGRIVNLDNEPIKFNRSFPKVNGIIATNGLLHDQVIAALTPYRDLARVD